MLWLLMVFYHLFQGVDTFCCEKMDAYEHVNHAWRYSCFVSFATIDPCNCVIPSTRSDVYIFNVAFQEKVKKLPNDFDNRFPNLSIYNASHCSIQSISNENFDEMIKLQYLYLDNNQIEVIPKDTFSVLGSLIMLHLRKKLIFV